MAALERITVFGRANEVSTLDRFLRDVTSGPETLVIEGDAGIGKSALWETALESAERSGFSVLSCRAVESEASLTFSDLSDLLAELPEALFNHLPLPQRHALDVALLRASPGLEPPDQRAVAVATLGVLNRLAERSPVLVAIDDWPSLDTASRAAVEYAVRRVSALPVGLLITARRDVLPEATASLERALTPRKLARIELGALELGAFGAMLASRGASASGPGLMRLHAASGGNPLFGLKLTASSSGDHPEVLPTPTSLRAFLDRRLTDLPKAVRSVVLLVAAAPRPTIDLIAAASGDRRAALVALDTAQEERLLVVRGAEVRFAHPVYRSLLYSGASDDERRRAHQALAQASFGEERVRHRALAAAEPDETLAAELEDAAREAHLRGAALAACELADLALTLTPPKPSPARTGRLIAAGRLYLGAFDPTGAKRFLELAVEEDDVGPRRAETLFWLATAERYSTGRGTRAILERALAEAPPAGTLRAQIHRDLGIVHAAAGRPDAATHYRAALELARETDDTTLVAQLGALRAMVAFVTGHGVRRDLLDAALAAGSGTERFAMESRPRVVASHILRFSDDLEGSRQLLREEYDREAQRGAETNLPYLVVWLVELETWAGRFDEADRYAEEGYAAAVVSGSTGQLSFILGARALLRAWQGAEEHAREDAEAAIAYARSCGAYQPLLTATQALALLDLCTGDPAAAHARLEPISQLQARRGDFDPGWWGLRLVPDDVEALARMGRLAEAEALLAPFEERADRLERRWAIAAAGRCRALLSSSAGDGEAAQRALEKAFDALEAVGQPQELARTHLVAGEVARRGRSKLASRNHAQTARNIFSEIGAESWARRADQELGRLRGARTASLELTGTELKVAELVAAGRTNREVTGELYMGLRTVEAHLSQIYRKLGVRSRSELARWWVSKRDA